MSGPRYLYAVVDADTLPTPPDVEGLEDAELSLVVAEGLAAVVSPLKKARVRPQRKNLAAHQAVLAALLEQTTPAPFAFGAVVDGDDGARAFLAEHAEALRTALKTVDGQVEMGLKVRWDVPDIFAYFLHREPELAALRDQVFQPGHSPTQDEQIELGKRFDRLRTAAREQAVQTILGELEPTCTLVRRLGPKDDAQIETFACLVPTGDSSRFEESVLAAARHFDDHHAFDFSGPWSPFSFVDVKPTG